MAEPRQLASRSALVLAGDVLGALAGYVAIFTVTRYMGPSALGAYEYAIALTAFAGLAANLGLRNAHTHHVAKGTPLAKALGTYMPLRFGITLGFAALLLLGYTLFSQVSPQGLRDTTARLLALALAMHVVTSLRFLAYDTWAAQYQIQREQLAKLLENALILVLVAASALAVAHASGRWVPAQGVAEWVAGVLGIHGTVSPLAAGELLAQAYLVAKVATIVPILWWWRSDRTPVGTFDRATAASYFHYGLPLAPQAVLLLVVKYTDRWTIGFFGTNHDVGLYAAVDKLSNIGLMVAMSAATLLLPLFSQLHGQGRSSEAHRTFLRVERLLLLLSVPAVAAMVALPRQGIHIFLDDAVLPAARTLQLLALAVLAMVMAKPIRLQFLGTGRTHENLLASVLQMVLNVILDVLLVPSSLLGVPLAGMGIEGAAWGTLVSAVAAYAYLRWRAHAVHGVPWVDATLLRGLALGAGLAGVWMAAGRLLPEGAFDRVWELAAWGVAGGVLFLVAARLTGALTRQDVRLLAHTADPRRLWVELRAKR